MQKVFLGIFFVIVISMYSVPIMAQITSEDATYTGVTDFGDTYFLFCAQNEGESNGALLAKSDFGNATFSWEKYDSIAKLFVPYTGAQQDDSLQSLIRQLDDGCYKVTINASGNVISEQAWILHDWIEVTKTEIPDSSSLCVGFKIWTTFDYAPLNVYQTSTGEKSTVRNNPKFYYAWYNGSEFVSAQLNAYIEPPIASNTPIVYNVIITDNQFGCTGEGKVEYNSKVPESGFSANPMSGEAVLEVVFSNNSINYDSAYWLFYKDTYQISREIEDNKGEAVDSIDFILKENSPIYEYKLSGQYLIKLITVKVNDTGNCYDSLMMPKGTFIEVDTTLVDAPNFFTPNGDLVNDEFVIKTQSLKSLNVKIYNRWGGQVHSWKYTNITSSDYTYEHSVWDGRIGNRMASPGVYYYIIQYEGRQVDYDSNRTRNVKGTKTGFVHLFRNKN